MNEKLFLTYLYICYELKEKKPSNNEKLQASGSFICLIFAFISKLL